MNIKDHIIVFKKILSVAIKQHQAAETGHLRLYLCHGGRYVSVSQFQSPRSDNLFIQAKNFGRSYTFIYLVF